MTLCRGPSVGRFKGRYESAEFGTAAAAVTNLVSLSNTSRIPI